jgi:hypothetical protein
MDAGAIEPGCKKATGNRVVNSGPGRKGTTRQSLPKHRKLRDSLHP